MADETDSRAREARARRLLPFRAREGQRVAQAPVLKSARHVPAMLHVELSGHVPELDLVVGQVDRAHPLRVDPRPHGMSVPPTVLFVKDDGARLVFQTELSLDFIDGLLERLNAGLRPFGRVQAHGEQMLLTARTSGDGIRLAECAAQVLAGKAAHLVQLDVIVVAHRQKVAGKLLTAAALYLVVWWDHLRIDAEVMLLIGTLIGGGFAAVLFAFTVVGLPVLLEREVDFITAIIASIRAVAANLVVMAAWAAIIAALLAVGMVPFFLGLFIALPVLGHASWHVYRRLMPDGQDLA